VSSPREIFVPARGQYENIGDVLLRRQLLDWLRECGPLRVYVGYSPDGYDDGLRLRPEDVRYRSFVQWYMAGLASAARGRASYVFKPGEIQLTLLGMKEHVSMLPLLALVRLRGGVVARVGVGSRNFSRIPRALIMPSIAASDLSLWRDSETAAYLGHGDVMPDLGFGEGSPGSVLEPAGSDSESPRRDALVVSMRSDLGHRPYPSAEWLSAVRTLAGRHNLEVWVATQVHVDDERSRQLAVQLDARLLPWDGTAHHEQEERLRALYRRSALVVSDRLHVLVAALTEGAVPAALLLDSSDKIARHFAAAFIDDVSVASASLGEQGIVDRLEALLGRREELLSQLEFARADLRSAHVRLAAVLGDRRRSRFAAFHVGRHGEAAGGMTQVVNGYLAGTFAEFDARAISSRDGSTGIRALRLAASAAARILRLRNRNRSVVIVHLSERGSFVREGALLLLARARGFATIAHLHGSEFTSFTDAHPRLVGRVLRAADLILTLSDETSAVARRFVPAEAVMLVPNAVASAIPNPKERLIVFGGAVTERKGVDVLVEAWRAIGQRLPGHGWRLVVAGPLVEPSVVPESLPDAEFLGAVRHDELMALLARSSVAVLPSRDEAMPMFLLEAMARSNAIVSTTVGGIPAVLGNGAGSLVPPGDARGLVEALERLMTDAGFREDSARRALAAFERTYSTEAVFPRLEAAWKTALELRSRRVRPPRLRRALARARRA
jgi:glycosyltransferase involved in cell wall biosynthesis